MSAGELASEARGFAQAGMQVFPLEPGTKVPLGRLAPRGFRSATTDVATIDRWWAEVPDANIGLAVPDDLIVIDVDPRNGGEATWAEVTAGRDLDTLTSYSGRRDGGRHLWLWRPEGRLVNTLGAGVDVKIGGTGYVVAPPSIHPDTQQSYTWGVPVAAVATTPPWLAEMLQVPRRPPPAATSVPRRATTGPNILCVIDALPWREVWPEGWEYVGDATVNGERVERWRRPGATSAHSAVCWVDGGCYVHSTAVGWITAGGHSKATVYAYRVGLNGDVAALAKQLHRAAVSHRRAAA